MSAFNAIVSGITSLFTSNTNTNTGPTGADAVRTAVTELENLADKTFEAMLGEPDIVQDEDVEYFNDPKVVIPILDAPFDGANKLVFDLPESRDDDFSTFNQLLELFDLDFESIEQLAGETVPMTFIGGNASVLWDEITRPDSGDDSEEESESTESSGESGDSTADDSDKAGENTESESSEEESGDSTDDSTGVNVEEKTVSTSEEDGDV